ncbi:hypothetical protein GDO81_023601 [Engystomops pustulosus]|uniref:Uncharacterized protein n=1 Tax=Engystomops pustulosus TaxID=76066 RepID=A0AAV6Z6P1_ENGPU|nr:hypothetical protein GDO81_023601 [Engystomops pustulosus]
MRGTYRTYGVVDINRPYSDPHAVYYYPSDPPSDTSLHTPDHVTSCHHLSPTGGRIYIYCKCAVTARTPCHWWRHSHATDTLHPNCYVT